MSHPTALALPFRPLLASALLCAAPAMRALDAQLVNLTGEGLLVGAQAGAVGIQFRTLAGDEAGEFGAAPRKGYALGDGETLEVRIPDEDIPAAGHLTRLSVATALEPAKRGYLLLQMRPLVAGLRPVALTPVLGGRRWVRIERDTSSPESTLFYLDSLAGAPGSSRAVAPDPGGETLAARDLREAAARQAAGAPPVPETKAAPKGGTGCACSIL